MKTDKNQIIFTTFKDLRYFKKGKKKYYYIAEAVKNRPKVIQKSVLYVGTADSLYEKLIKLKKKS